jgi:formylglycine-generating enzyme required for sulfatase activity
MHAILFFCFLLCKQAANFESDKEYKVFLNAVNQEVSIANVQSNLDSVPPKLKINDQWMPEIKRIVENMVYLQGGALVMGCSDKDCHPFETPAHLVNVSEFHLSKYEVTVAEFAAFVAATAI